MILAKTTHFWGTAATVFLLDQLSKIWVRSFLHWRESIEVIPGIFNLAHVRNTGVAFGMFAGGPHTLRTAIHSGVTVIAMVIILLFLRRLGPRKKAWALGLGLVFGGACGNFADRVRFGFVLDFLDVYWRTWHWPAFNVADSAITVGCVLLLFKILTDKQSAHVS